MLEKIYIKIIYKITILIFLKFTKNYLIKHN